MYNKNVKEVIFIKERIRQIRDYYGITQKELADKLGMKLNTVTAYEAGRRVPSLKVVKAMCNAFNIREDWLVHGTGPMMVDRDAELVKISESIPTSDDKLLLAALRLYSRLTGDEKPKILNFAQDLLKEMQGKN